MVRFMTPARKIVTGGKPVPKHVPRFVIEEESEESLLDSDNEYEIPEGDEDGLYEAEDEDSEADLPPKKPKADTWTITEKEVLVHTAMEHKLLLKARGPGSGRKKLKGIRLCKTAVNAVSTTYRRRKEISDQLGHFCSRLKKKNESLLAQFTSRSERIPKGLKFKEHEVIALLFHGIKVIAGVKKAHEIRPKETTPDNETSAEPSNREDFVSPSTSTHSSVQSKSVSAIRASPRKARKAQMSELKLSQKMPSTEMLKEASISYDPTSAFQKTPPRVKMSAAKQLAASTKRTPTRRTQKKRLLPTMDEEDEGESDDFEPMNESIYENDQLTRPSTSTPKEPHQSIYTEPARSFKGLTAKLGNVCELLQMNRKLTGQPEDPNLIRGHSGHCSSDPPMPSHSAAAQAMSPAKSTIQVDHPSDSPPQMNSPAASPPPVYSQAAPPPPVTSPRYAPLPETDPIQPVPMKRKAITHPEDVRVTKQHCVQLPDVNPTSTMSLQLPENANVFPLEASVRKSTISAGDDLVEFLAKLGQTKEDIERLRNVNLPEAMENASSKTMAEIRILETKLKGDMEALKNVTIEEAMENASSKTITEIGILETKLKGEMEALKNVTVRDAMENASSKTITEIGIMETKLKGEMDSIRRAVADASVKGDLHQILMREVTHLAENLASFRLQNDSKISEMIEMKVKQGSADVGMKDVAASVAMAVDTMASANSAAVAVWENCAKAMAEGQQLFNFSLNKIISMEEQLIKISEIATSNQALYLKAFSGFYGVSDSIPSESEKSRIIHEEEEEVRILNERLKEERASSSDQLQQLQIQLDVERAQVRGLQEELAARLNQNMLHDVETCTYSRENHQSIEMQGSVGGQESLEPQDDEIDVDLSSADTKIILPDEKIKYCATSDASESLMIYEETKIDPPNNPASINVETASYGVGIIVETTDYESLVERVIPESRHQKQAEKEEISLDIEADAEAIATLCQFDKGRPVTTETEAEHSDTRHNEIVSRVMTKLQEHNKICPPQGTEAEKNDRIVNLKEKENVSLPQRKSSRLRNAKKNL